MIEIGRYNTLPVHSIQGSRILLGTDDDCVRLPAREVDGELEVGSVLRVFVYTDEGPIATLKEPRVTVGNFAFLEVIDVNRSGAFLDWGLPKDLFVPFGNQYTPMRVGRSYVVGVRVHRRTNRIVGASLLAGMFDDDVAHLSPGDAVDLLVYGETDRGFQVVVDGAHAGLVYHDQAYERLRPGAELRGWVSLVRPDHRLDITLQRTGVGGIDDARAVILAALDAAGGALPLHDKSPPAEIQRRLAMSKKVFKKAVGQLYKDRIIELSEGGIPEGPVSAHLPALLDRALLLFPDQPAVHCHGEWLTYSQIGDRVSRLAGVLVARGVRPGDRVAAWLPNRREYLECYFAVALAGAVLVPVNHRLAVREIIGVLAHSGARWLVADATWSEAIGEVLDASPGIAALRVGGAPWGEDYERALASAEPLVPTAPLASGDDPAQIYYTSGTTGDPKGVVLTHANVAHHALMAVAELGLSDRDTWLHAAPMFHLADAWATFAVTWVGGRHTMLPSFTPASGLDALQDGVTLTNLVPTMLNALVREPGASRRRYPSLRLVLSGGAPISPELVERVGRTFGCDYLQTYGLTETCPYLTFSTLAAHLDVLPEAEQAWYRACTGRPLAGVELRVVDGEGRDVPRDRRTVGEIIARGPSVTPGYWRNPEATAAAIRGGWLHTGDLAVMDPHGYVDIVDRAKDVIVTGGEQVFSVEVENALMEHPDVVEAAVVAAPDERWGEAVIAVVVRRAGSEVDGAALVEHCRALLARYKAPRRVDFAESLPRTGSHKIDKKAVRERYWQGRSRRVH